MLSQFLTATDLRKNLFSYINAKNSQEVVIKGKESNKVLVDESKYRKLEALANQFVIEDPEGEYKNSFTNDIIARAKDPQIDDNINSLADVL